MTYRVKLTFKENAAFETIKDLRRRGISEFSLDQFCDFFYKQHSHERPVEAISAMAKTLRDLSVKLHLMDVDFELIRTSTLGRGMQAYYAVKHLKEVA